MLTKLEFQMRSQLAASLRQAHKDLRNISVQYVYGQASALDLRIAEMRYWQLNDEFAKAAGIS